MLVINVCHFAQGPHKVRSKIITTRGRGMGPLPVLLERMESVRAVERAFCKSAMPYSIVDNLDMRVPFISMVRLFEEAADQTGDRLFGLRVGLEMDHGAYGKWAQYLSASPTLAGAIERSIKSVSIYQDGSRMSVRNEVGHIVWAYHSPKFGKELYKQHSDHVLPAMINFARHYLGPTWTPDWVELDYPPDGKANELEYELGIKIRFGREGIGLAFTPEELNAKNTILLFNKISLTYADLLAFYQKDEHRTLIDRIEDLIRIRLLDGNFEIEGLAMSLGISKRALQSILNKEGLSYRDLLLKIRMEKAFLFITKSNSNITQIASELGYEEVSSFSRAFYRWYGRYPSDFRKLPYSIAVRNHSR